VSHDNFSSGKERIRHSFDWTVRRHPSVAAGIAGAAITLAGAYVAVNADGGGENVAATRPPADGSAAGPDRPSGPRSGPGAPPGIPHPPLSRADADSGAAAGPDEASGPQQRPSPSPSPSPPRPPAPSPAPDCILSVDLLGNAVKICT
jgi:hypothetical protein